MPSILNLTGWTSWPVRWSNATRTMETGAPSTKASEGSGLVANWRGCSACAWRRLPPRQYRRRHGACLRQSPRLRSPRSPCLVRLHRHLRHLRRLHRPRRLLPPRRYCRHCRPLLCQRPRYPRPTPLPLTSWPCKTGSHWSTLAGAIWRDATAQPTLPYAGPSRLTASQWVFW